MDNKVIYIAYILQKSKAGGSMLRVAFEHPIVEYWGEAEGQKILKDYFKEHYFGHDEPVVIEQSDIFHFMPFEGVEDDGFRAILQVGKLKGYVYVSKPHLEIKIPVHPTSWPSVSNDSPEFTRTVPHLVFRLSRKLSEHKLLYELERVDS